MMSGIFCHYVRAAKEMYEEADDSAIIKLIGKKPVG